MANKTSVKKCNIQLQKGKVQDTKLEHKLQSDLETDILRLFQDSLYCDLKLTVDSSSLLTHSCILKTRAGKFYKFIYAEFEFFEENGVSVFNIFNASFTHLQSFLENIYTNVHTPKAEEFIIKHLQESKTRSLRFGASAKSAATPESDLFYTPKCSPSELQKPFSSSLKYKENDVVSYYKIVSVDDIPVDDKLDEKSICQRELESLEKELAEQDELLSSFKTILSKKTKTKPNSLSLVSSQSAKKPKPKFNKKFEANTLIYDDIDKGKCKVPLWKPNTIGESKSPRKKLADLKGNQKNHKPQEKIDLGVALEKTANSLCESDMDVSTTGVDSGLDNSSICQQETSPKENTVSETSGVDLTEAAINEEIPNDETSTKQSTGSSVSSEVGTWDAHDDFKVKSPLTISDESVGRNHDMDETEKSIRDCEIFLYMERQGSLYDEYPRKIEMAYQYAEETLAGDELCAETDHHPNNDEEENYFNHRNDGVMPRENLSDVNLTNENCNANESLKQGESDDIIPNSYFARPPVHDTKTPPCTPKKIKAEVPLEEIEKEEVKPKSFDCNNSTGVSNYFIDASSLLDEDEIISPPISLINFKSLPTCEESEKKPEEKAPSPVPKKVVSNFYVPDSSDDSVSYLKEQERRQGEIIFKNSIPHFSKHVVESSDVEETERLRGGADRYDVEDDAEQVVPSAVICKEENPTETSFAIESNFFESMPPSEYASDSPEDQADGNADTESQAIPSSRDSVKEVSSSVCSESPNLRRRNESAPIVSGGMDFIENEEKVQRKPSQSSGEAWVVTFDDKKKTRSRITSSDTGSEAENGDDKRSFHRSKKNEPSVEFYIKEQSNERGRERSEPEPRVNAVEKSSSFGYFLDFGKNHEVASRPEPPAEKKTNMFSMFIGMEDDSKPNKTKPALERQNTYDKNLEKSQEGSEEVKKSFYMFIESDSPNVKRKQIPKKPLESSTRKSFMRTQSYTIEDRLKADSKDVECSSSDNSLPYMENDRKSTSRGRTPLSRFRGTNHESKITAWSETKPPQEREVACESWLRTNDVQVNYTGRSNGHYFQKDSTFVMDDIKSRRVEEKRTKPLKRDSGVILSEKSDDSFVKLSDLDSSDNKEKKPKDRMSQSIQENSQRKSMIDKSTLSKSIGSEGEKIKSTSLYDKQVNKSLSRLFPNLSAQSLASLGRKDNERGEGGDFHTSETFEVSSSLQSSVEPTGLEISTSETDVSTHGGTISRLGEDLLKMFLEEISPDVVVEVGGRRIKAHKCILSSRCQYFAAMLSGGWVESAGNVISLQGYSYNAVHFALRHIYSGESRIPESLNIVELATLADMLCLVGLQEIISYNLKVKYCHSFHVPCSICSVGVIDCLPITAAYGLDDLYRKCLRWITKFFVKIWPTKSFGSLPKELLEKCYQHYVVHMTVDNILDTIVNIDKVRGSLPNVRWAESVSRLVNKLHDATVRYIAEHFSSVLTSDNFLALGKEAGWNVSRLEDSLIETIRYLPPEQACWSHARLHRILTVATGPDPPSEMDWNENFLKLLQLIAELVENSLIKQAPRAAKSKAWRQMEPELRSRIQEAACLVLPDQEPSPSYRRTSYVKKELHQPNIPQTAKSRTLEIRQIKLAMSQQASRNVTSSRPLSLQIDQRPKKDSRFVPLRPSVSTSSVRKAEPTEGIRKTQSRSQILTSTISEPKKIVNSKYSEVKSRYLEPRSPQKNVSDKPTVESNQRRTIRYISSSDSSRNCSPALRLSNSRSSIPQARRYTVVNARPTQNSVLRSDSTSTLDSKRDRSFMSTKSDPPSAKTLSRLTGEENMSTDSLCTDSLLSDKDATLRRKPGKENLGDRKKIGTVAVTKSTSNSPIARRHNTDSWSSATSRSSTVKKMILPKSDSKSSPPKRFAMGKIPVGSQNKNVSSTRTNIARNQKYSGKSDSNLVNGNSNRRRIEVDSENNKKNSKESGCHSTGISRSGTFLKDEPTVLKKPQVETEA